MKEQTAHHAIRTILSFSAEIVTKEFLFLTSVKLVKIAMMETRQRSTISAIQMAAVKESFRNAGSPLFVVLANCALKRAAPVYQTPVPEAVANAKHALQVAKAILRIMPMTMGSASAPVFYRTAISGARFATLDLVLPQMQPAVSVAEVQRLNRPVF